MAALMTAAALLTIGSLHVDVAWGQTKGERQEHSLSRLVHRFTFDEPDNLYNIPKFWVQFPARDHVDPEFPRYAEGFFDSDIGCDEPPSFYLHPKGRSVAFRYIGPNTRIKPGDYLVAGRIRPDRLRYARATISAYYLDWENEVIEGTQRFGRLIGPTDIADSWQEVRVHLPVAPPNAHFVGITCWVVQQDVWMEGIKPHRYISLRDIDGGAWFDDLVVLALPRAILESAHPGNIVERPHAVQLLATVADDDASGLEAVLTVNDQDGVEVFNSDVSVRTFDDEEPDRFSLRNLGPGLYTALMDISSLGEPILRRRLTFAVLGKSQRPRGAVVRQMGVIVTQVRDDQVADQLALVDALGVGAAKLPLWTGDPARPGYEKHRNALHNILDEMVKQRISVTGIFSGPPTDLIRSAGEHARSLLDILSDDPQGWQGLLRSIVAPYASIFHSWQLGRDGDLVFINDDRVPKAFEAVRLELQSMMTVPSMTAVAAASRLPESTALPAQNYSVDLPDDIRPDYIVDHLSPYKSLPYNHIWVSVDAPDTRGFSTSAVLADWAIKVIRTRWTGVETVFVPQLWHTRDILDRALTEPTRSYLVLRTIIDAIGDRPPAYEFNIGKTAKALAFADDRDATVVLWDPAAPAEGRSCAIQLGSASSAIDLCGRSVPLTRTPDGRHELLLSPEPIFVMGVEPWIIAFRSGLRLTPNRINFSYELRSHTLSVANPHRLPISGSIVLTPPVNWELEPRRFRFSLYPNEIQAFDIRLRHPNNEDAGIKTLHAAIELQGQKTYNFDTAVELELGLSDVDVWGYAVTDGDDLLVRHGVTSRAQEVLAFRTFAMYPGRSRQYRVINELLPGQTLTIEYRFHNVQHVSGKNIRLSLQEINGPRMHNLRIVVP